jgi:hypothetical protein
MSHQVITGERMRNPLTAGGKQGHQYVTGVRMRHQLITGEKMSNPLTIGIIKGHHYITGVLMSDL